MSFKGIIPTQFMNGVFRFVYNLLKMEWIGSFKQASWFYSAYLWSFTNIYTGGKYIADGVWDEKAISKQVGVAALFLHLKQSNLLDISLS